MAWHHPPPDGGGRHIITRPLIIGLTGGIAMGKSTVAAQFASLGVKTISADDIVHELFAHPDKVIPVMQQRFPEAVKRGEIDREALGHLVFNDDIALRELENLLHPLVFEVEQEFVEQQGRLGAEVVLLDVPLLFESGRDAYCDITVVVTCPYFLQRQRVLCRPKMSEEKLEKILKRQMPDAYKRARADYVVHTGLGRGYSFAQVKRIMQKLGYA